MVTHVNTRNAVAEHLFPWYYYYPLMVFDVVSLPSNYAVTSALHSPNWQV